MSWKDPRNKKDIVYILTMLIPIGYTVAYSVLAKLVDTSPRAIGAYMRSNNDIIVVPCHRVVSVKGLGGYSRGTKFKKRLLVLEGALVGHKLRRINSPEEFWRIIEENAPAIIIENDP